jgi:hypothetical protein
MCICTSVPALGKPQVIRASQVYIVPRTGVAVATLLLLKRRPCLLVYSAFGTCPTPVQGPGDNIDFIGGACIWSGFSARSATFYFRVRVRLGCHLLPTLACASITSITKSHRFPSKTEFLLLMDRNFRLRRMFFVHMWTCSWSYWACSYVRWRRGVGIQSFTRSDLIE